MGVGPPIEHRFYYDFEFPKDVRLSDEDLPKIEAEMRKIAGEGSRSSARPSRAKRRRSGWPRWGSPSRPRS